MAKGLKIGRIELRTSGIERSHMVNMRAWCHGIKRGHGHHLDVASGPNANGIAVTHRLTA